MASASSDYVREQIEKSGDANFTCVDAETAVLGYFLCGNADNDDDITTLRPDDFSNPACARIFTAIQRVFADGLKVDAVTVDAALSKLYPDRAGKYAEGITRCMQQHLKYRGYKLADYIRIVKELSQRRKAIRRFEELAGKLRDPTADISETMAEIEGAATDADADDEVEWMSCGEVALQTYEYLEKRQSGEIKAITSGLGAIDKMIGGFFPGEMTIIAARPSVGKSAFGAFIANAAAEKGFKVYIVSCEMPPEGYGQRMFSSTAWVEGDKLRKADLDEGAWEKLGAALSKMDSLPISFAFKKNTLEQVVKSVRKLARRHEIDMLIVDYIGIMQTQRHFEKDMDRVKYISSTLKQLSMEAHIPVLALCQVNRDAHGSMPTLAQIRDTGAIEQDSDGVIFIHRPDRAEDSSVDPRDRPFFNGFEERGTAYIALGVAKQRNGSVGTVNAVFDPQFMRYVEITRTEEQ